MGLSSSKTKTTSAPATFATPFLNQALSNTQSVFNQNQGNLQSLSASALQGYNAIAPAAYSPSSFVTAAQNSAQGIASGQNLGTNPGQQTYSSLMSAQNPSLSTLSGLTNSATQNPYASGLQSLASNATANPALGTLSTLSQGSTNPASAAYTNLLDGGSNNALPGLAAYGYSSGSFGAGDGTLGKFASTGNNGQVNAADAYDQAELSGKYLNNNPYIDAIANQATAAATKAQNQRFGLSGLGAGNDTAYSGALGSAVADANNTLRYNNYNTERGYQEAASGRVSNNYNLGQDRSQAAANSLSAGSRADVATRLGALNSLSTANNNQTQNALTAASGLGSTYNNQQQLQLSAANSLGSLYNQGNQTAQSAYGTLGSLYNQGQQNATSAATALGNQYNATAGLNLNAAQAADSSQQALLQQQLAALGLTGGLTDAQYAGISPALSLLNASANIPYAGVNAYSGIVNNLTGQYGTKTTTGTPSILSDIGQAVNIGSSAVSAYKASDRRLKTDIVKVGELHDGLGVYEYNYVWDEPRQRGVMADEVATLRPWALGPTISGYATVNYGAL